MLMHYVDSKILDDLTLHKAYEVAFNNFTFYIVIPAQAGIQRVINIGNHSSIK